jgi:hypothetical protein
MKLNESYEIDKEISSLIDNMYYHFHHDNFMTGYSMNRTKCEGCLGTGAKYNKEWKALLCDTCDKDLVLL